MKRRNRVLCACLAGLLLAACSGCGNSKNEGQTIGKDYTESQALDDTGIAAADLGDDSSTVSREVDESVTGEISYWTWDKGAPYYAQQFATKYPNAQVEVNVFADYYTKLQQMLSSGAEVPDVIMVENAYYGELANSTAVEDLGSEPYNAMEMRDDYYDFWFDSGIGTDGVLRVMPNSPGMAANFYRRDIAKELFGTDDPEEVGKLLSDWDAVYEYGLKLKEISNGEKYIVPNAKEVFNTMVAQTGEARVEDNVINTEMFIEPLNTAKKFREAGIDGKQTDWSPEWSAGMKNGQVLMYQSGSWGESYTVIANVQDTQDGLWGVTSVPGGNVNNGGNGFAIPKAADNKELAWTFINFAVTDVDMQADQLKKFACFPALKEAADDPYFELPVPLFDGQVARKKYAELGEDMIFSPRTKYDSAISTILDKYVENVFNGQMTAEDAVEKMKSEMMSQYKELS